MDKEELFRTLAAVNPEGFVSELNIVRENMEAWGGSFERGLAQALLHADMQNAVTIKIAFTDLWEKWLDWDKRRKGQKNDN